MKKKPSQATYEAHTHTHTHTHTQTFLETSEITLPLVLGVLEFPVVLDLPVTSQITTITCILRLKQA